jgi:hypothetical protein
MSEKGLREPDSQISVCNLPILGLMNDFGRCNFAKFGYRSQPSDGLRCELIDAAIDAASFFVESTFCDKALI